MSTKKLLVSPYIIENDSIFAGIFVNETLGTIKCISKCSTKSKQKDHTIAHLGSCMLFRSSFRLDERFPHGIEDVEFSMQIQKHYKTKLFLMFWLYIKVSLRYQNILMNKKKHHWKVKSFFFDNQIKYQIVLGSMLHVLFHGRKKRTLLCNSRCCSEALDIEEKSYFAFCMLNRSASEVAGSSITKYKITSRLVSWSFCPAVSSSSLHKPPKCNDC